MHLRIDVTPPRGQISHTINVEQDRALVGRASFSEVRLPFPIVSSRHLELERRQGRWFLRDVGSSNGTFVGEERLEPGTWVQIHDAMEVKIVDLGMRFHYVREANVGLTLAQSGTLVRKLVLAAAEKVVDDDAAFVEVVEGTGCGGRVYLPDDLQRARIGHGAERPLAGVTPPIVIGRNDDRFTVEEGATHVNDVPTDGSIVLDSGDRIRVGDSVLVFFDPLEELLDDFGGSAARPQSKVVETVSGDVPPGVVRDPVAPEPVNASGAKVETGAIAASRPDASASVEDSHRATGGGTGAIPVAGDSEQASESRKEKRGLGAAEIALIAFALAAFLAAGVILWAIFI